MLKPSRVRIPHSPQMFWSNFLNKTYNKLICASVLLVLIFFVFQIINNLLFSFDNTFIFRLFDLGDENNIPTYFSSFLFIILAIISWFIAGLEKEGGKKYYPWIITVFLFIFLGLDEVTQIHEQLTGPFQNILNTSGFLFFAWVIPYGIILILLSIFYIPFVLTLKNKRLLFFGAGIFLFGAIILEMIGSNLYEAGKNMDLIYILISSFEEIFEIIGLLIAIMALKKEMFFKLNS